MNFKHVKVVIVSIQLHKGFAVDLVLEFRDAEVLHLDRESDSSLQADGHRWQLVSVLQKLQLRTAVERFTLELNGQRFAVKNLEEDVQVVLFDLLGEVEHAHIHLLVRCERAAAGLNRKDVLLQNMLLESLLRTGFTGIGPRLHLDGGVVWHFKLPVSLNTSDVLKRQVNVAGLASVLDRHFAEVPVKAA